MLEIPIAVNVTKEQAQKAIEDFVNGVRGDLKDIIGPGNFSLEVETRFTESGVKEVISDYKKVASASKEYEQALKRSVSTQTGSATSLRQSVNTLKQQRDAVIRGSDAWKSYNEEIGKTAAKLRAQQGVQVGSLTDLRRQRDELLKLRDATARFPSGPTGSGGGPTWDDLNRQIKELDGSINKVTPGFSQFFSVLSRVATIQAGFIAITSAIGALGGVINAYVGRTKQIEAFNLALKNVGLTQAETTATFREAAAIASRLGAPVQQVEKGYQRMVPALRAVGADSAKTAKFIENITARTQTLGLNTEQSGRLLEAFAQVLSKGKLQAEELNQQISELDGGFRSQLADALGVTTEQLTELVEQGAVTAPIFVDAINNMSNGVEELQKRVASGNATIQQLQNLVGNINVQVLQEIGKQIEPGIRAFLRLSLAVADFFKEFTKTETFASLTTIFNQIAKGLEVFVNNLLSAVKAVESLLSPIFGLIGSVLGLGEEFGGLIGITINLVGGLLVLKGILAGFSVLSSITKNVKSFGQEMFIAGKGVNYLSDTAKKSGFSSIRQGFENLRAVSVGLSEKIKQTVSSFLGLDRTLKASGDAVQSSKSQFKQLELGLGATASQAQKVKPSIDSIALSISTKFANAINGAADRIRLFIDRLRGVTPQTQQLSLALDQVGLKADGLGNKFRNLASSAGSAFKQIASSLSEVALSAAIGGVIAAIGAGINVNKAAEQATRRYAEANNVGAVKARLFLEEQKKAASATAQTANQTSQSYKESASAINQYSQEQTSAANRNKAFGVGLTVAGVAAAGFAIKILGAAAAAGTLAATGGLAAPVVAALTTSALTLGAKGFVVAAAGAGLAAGAVNRFGEASKELEKSAGGKNFLNSIKEQAKETQNLIKRVEGLGGQIGQTDFSSFAKGSVSLQKLRGTYEQVIETSKEYIEAKRAEVKAAEEQLASAKDDSEVKKLKAIISEGKNQIRTYEAVREAANASLEAIKEQNAAKIAGGDADALAAASAEELTKAIELQTNAIDSSALESRTEALKKYGQTQAQVGQLETANLGIELGAINQRLAGYQKILDALNKRKAEGKTLNEEEKKLASDLTKTIAEETLKQTEIQKQLGDAIVAGFERGVQKARELAGVYGQVAASAKTSFDNISGAVSTGLSSALSLVDAVAQRELEGAQQGSLFRKAIILEQLRAAALANEAEANIAKLKLAVQTRIAQNEARIAQIRLETEAKIAEARGDFDLAQAYREAASTQGEIIGALQKQYEIETKSIDLQRQAKDQALIQKGLQEGIGQNANQAASFIGVQKVNLQQATGELKKMVQDSSQLVTNYGNAAVKASDIKVSSEGRADAAGNAEAQKVKQAFDEAKNSVAGVNEELSKTPDAVLSIAKNFTNLTGEIEKTKRVIADIQAILNSGPGGGRAARTPVVGRATGGPVSAGTQYLVNDGGGREAFVNKFGNFSMLPAGRNIHWTAPTSGTVIPAHLVDRYRRAADLNKQINATSVAAELSTSRGNMMSSSIDSGNLIQRVASAMNGSGGTQRITNNVTIQSQEPVTDASKIMTNVARMRLRNARRR